MALALKRLLEARGYQVRTAWTLAGALAYLLAAPRGFDVVLIDLELTAPPAPALDKALSRMEPRIPVVFMTAGSSLRIPDGAPWVYKPVTSGDLERALLQAIVESGLSER